MIKLVFCLKRRPEMTREEFQTYWYEKHAPLVKMHATTLGIKRYVQVHSFEHERSEPIQQSRGGPEEYDGVAELWYESFEALAALRSPEATAAGRELLDDERKFIDLANSPLWWAQERPVIE
ncbi:MAG: EthD domain-containing protein [Dehalococcoidia bacterium]